MQAGQPVELQQPPVSSQDFFRAMATVIYSGGRRVITLDVVTFVDAATGRCTAYGTASAP